jgi:hypothetical protein
MMPVENDKSANEQYLSIGEEKFSGNARRGKKNSRPGGVKSEKMNVK